MSKIEWTGRTWNPVVGCSVVSPGCTNCYAMRHAARLERCGVERYAGLTKPTKAGPVWTGEVRVVESAMTLPLRTRKPTTWFVNSMSDLFHESVPDEAIDRVFAVMAEAHWHEFQILTKRSARMRAYMNAARMRLWARVAAAAMGRGERPPTWPLPNVWLGVSAEDQRRADERVPDLLATSAAIRFVSAEPLLGPTRFDRISLGTSPAEFVDMPHITKAEFTVDALAGAKSIGWRGLDWIIVGGESGHGARRTWTPNVRAIVQQCERAGTPVFVKQLGAVICDRNDAGFEGCEPHEWPDVDPDDVEHDLDGTSDGYQGAPVRIRLRDSKGGDPSEWPADLRVRQMPTTGASHASA